MHRVILEDRLESGESWTEEIPPGSISRFSASFGANSGIISMSFKINGTWRNIKSFIKQVIGYSQVSPQFDPDNLSTQGPYTLTRALPARHPALSSFRATKIIGVVGGGLRTGTGDGKIRAALPLNAPPDEPKIEGTGHYGQFEFVWMNVQFEIPSYPVLSDAERDLSGIHPTPPTPQPEYKRFHEFLPQSSLETLARRGEQWAFCLGSEIVGQGAHVGDRLLRQPKMSLKIVGYNIHQDYIMLGRLVPSNYYHRLGTVNARPFPFWAFRDQNQAGDIPVQYPPGTCLLLPEKITMSAQNHPAVMKNELNASYFPRCCDVETNILVFDPPTTDTSTIDLSGRDAFGFPLNGQAFTRIRGHNLAPSVMPSQNILHTDTQWWATKRFPPGVPVPANAPPGNPSSDAYLLHRYSDFEALWGPPESMTP